MLFLRPFCIKKGAFIVNAPLMYCLKGLFL